MSTVKDDLHHGNTHITCIQGAPCINFNDTLEGLHAPPRLWLPNRAVVDWARARLPAASAHAAKGHGLGSGLAFVPFAADHAAWRFAVGPQA